MAMKLRIVVVFVSVLLGIYAGGDLWAQHRPSKERGDPHFRRKTNIDGNLVRTTVFNFGLTGRTGVVPDEIPYEWPKNTLKHYIALTGIFIGAEVVTADGDTIPIVDVPTFRQSPTGRTWNLEPVPGYLNPNSDKIAKSTDPDSWPPFWPDKMGDPEDPGWPGSWNGYFGKNQFNADQEIYFRCSDDLYDRYNYYPDTTDYSRRGLGLLIDVRVMEWSQILINDVVFILHEIKNDGTKDLEKVAFCLWLADLVGGDGDSMDDHPKFDLLEDVAWSMDLDGRGNQAFGDDPVGVAATAYLETPGNAIDGIDNDGDGEEGSPLITLDIIQGEDPTDLIDNNGNGLIDENMTHVPFAEQKGVGFRDRIDNDGDGEPGSPVITEVMLIGEIPGNGRDDNRNGIYDEDPSDVGKAFADGIDNNGNGEDESPVITWEMLEGEIFGNGRDDNGNGLIDEDSSDVGLKYADGIDNDGDGAIDEFIDEGIDEMIDESREDHMDNDEDWDPNLDDVGLDGNPFTQDPGQGDGQPTSGAGTPFPGEPNIDKTDVGESDQVGLTNVQYILAGTINFNQPDENFWNQLMIPGKFWDTSQEIQGDWDLFVSSGFFPLKAGQTERISMAIILGEDQEDALRNRYVAQQAYNADYQFAKAPITPTLVAVPGDGKVTLYWDDAAEKSYDRFMAKLGQPAYDFEGYRIYRATDPAFEDAFTITDADGNRIFYKPIAQFDLVDEWQGLHPVDVNGAHFDLGDNTGLKHSFVDTTVKNGQTYYYAVTAYDFGSVALDIPPSETPIAITVDPSGRVTMGPNVAIVTPNAPAAGYVPPKVSNIELVAGSATGWVNYRIVDPREVRDNHRYRITFEDTLIKSRTFGAPDTLTTKNFTLVDITDPLYPDTLLDRCTKLGPDDEVPITHGFQLQFHNERMVALNRALSSWNRQGIYNFDFKRFSRRFLVGMQKPSDYRIVFGEVGLDTARAFNNRKARLNLPAKPVNFKVTNLTEGWDIDFAFWELDGNDGRLTARPGESDVIIFLERDEHDSLVVTWAFSLLWDEAGENPQSGDEVEIRLSKPFLSHDVFEFTTRAAHIDPELARKSLDRIKVVPNPYVAVATWEPRNPFTTGRGPRSIHFTHLPARCTIRIFTVNGELVKVIEHNSPIDNGTAEWDLLSRDNLTVSYGIYIYQVDAPGIGQKIGKFAIIK